MPPVTSRGIALVEHGAIDTARLISHRFSLEQAGEAFDLVASLQDGVCKALIDI